MENSLFIHVWRFSDDGAIYHGEANLITSLDDAVLQYHQQKYSYNQYLYTIQLDVQGHCKGRYVPGAFGSWEQINILPHVIHTLREGGSSDDEVCELEDHSFIVDENLKIKPSIHPLTPPAPLTMSLAAAE